MFIRMQDWPMGIRVGGGFGFLIMGMAAIAYVGWVNLGKVEENAREIYQSSTIPGTELAKMSTDLLRYRNRVIQAVGAASEEDFSEFTQDLPGLEARIKQTLLDYKAKQSQLGASADESTKHMQDLQEALDAYWGLDRRTVEQVRHSWKATNVQEGERLRGAARQNAFFTAGPALDAGAQALDELLGTLRGFAHDQNEDAVTNSRNASRALWLVLLVSGTCSFLLGSFITRGVKVPVDRVNAALADIGRGDLTCRVLQESKDEMGILASNMNQFVERLHGTIAQVAEAAKVLAQDSSALSEVSREVKAGSQEQVGQSASAASAVEEMSATVGELAKNAHDVSRMAEEASKSAKIGGTVVAETIKQMGDLHQSVNDTAGKISLLGQRSQEISAIVKVITDIADQTNLLALNAAIEAARAGEQGRGFAVVADEVRKLAERTTKATSEISTMIAAVQRDTTDAVAAMEDGRARVEQGVTLVNQAGQHLKKILTNNETVTEMVHHMAGSISEQSKAANQVARNVQTVASISSQNELRAEQAHAATAQLSTMAAGLSESIHQFKFVELPDHKGEEDRLQQFQHS